MSDNNRKPGLHHVPALLTGTAALIAALTGVYVNLRDNREATVSAPSQRAAPAQHVTTPAPVPPMGPLRLQVERITVEHDGSRGTTDWRFTVEADGEPLFAFSQNALDDSGGRNVAMPRDAQGVLHLAPGKPVHLTIQGWRGGLLGFGTTPVATGEASLGGPSVLPVRVQAAKPEEGAFVFHLSAEPAR
jgi:hypothetical protein